MNQFCVLRDELLRRSPREFAVCGEHRVSLAVFPEFIKFLLRIAVQNTHCKCIEPVERRKVEQIAERSFLQLCENGIHIRCLLNLF